LAYVSAKGVFECMRCKDVMLGIQNGFMDEDVDSAKGVFECMRCKDNLVILGLMDMREIGLAEKLFGEMSERDVVLWMLMMSGFLSVGRVVEARKCFDCMPMKNVQALNTMISDAGLKALVDSAPALRSINLGCCSLLTVEAINNLADKLGPVLKELYIDECFDLDAKHIFFLDEAVAAYLEACGAPLRELSLNHVNKVPTLVLRNTHYTSMLDYCIWFAVLHYLSGVSAWYTWVAHHTAISLAKHARNLESLDLSFCREMTNEALGLIADSCSSLKMLKLFGCTQLTSVFTDGHSNEGVKIIGLVESQILKNIEAVELLPLRYSSA
ncbi:leucine-rich repeat, cysteine-containing subtype protein, partial [Tanacetum coccineum]